MPGRHRLPSLEGSRQPPQRWDSDASTGAASSSSGGLGRLSVRSLRRRATDGAAAGGAGFSTGLGLGSGGALVTYSTRKPGSRSINRTLSLRSSDRSPTHRSSSSKSARRKSPDGSSGSRVRVTRSVSDMGGYGYGYDGAGSTMSGGKRATPVHIMHDLREGASSVDGALRGVGRGLLSRGSNNSGGSAAATTSSPSRRSAARLARAASASGGGSSGGGTSKLRRHASSSSRSHGAPYNADVAKVKNQLRMSKHHKEIIAAAQRIALSTPLGGWNKTLRLITKHVILGNKEGAKDMKRLKTAGILNAAKQLPCYFTDDFVYMHVPAMDDTSFDISPYLDTGAKFIRDATRCNTRILVHCVAGVSRSATFVIMYLMAYKKHTLRKAIAKCRKAGADVGPNHSFRYALAMAEVRIHGGSSVATSRDPFWNFFAWNKTRNTVPQLAPENNYEDRRGCTPSCIIL